MDTSPHKMMVYVIHSKQKKSPLSKHSIFNKSLDFVDQDGPTNPFLLMVKSNFELKDLISQYSMGMDSQ